MCVCVCVYMCMGRLACRAPAVSLTRNCFLILYIMFLAGNVIITAKPRFKAA